MAETPEYRYDVFISYSHANEVWVEGTLLPRLEGARLRVCIDFRDFLPGKAALFNMQDAVRDSRFTLLVLTPDWVKSEWTLFESLLSRTKDPAGLQRRTIPLLLQASDLPDLIAMITWVDFADPDDRQIAWRQLLTGLGVPPERRGARARAPRLVPAPPLRRAAQLHGPRRRASDAERLAGGGGAAEG